MSHKRIISTNPSQDELCKRSSTLSKHLPKEKAMEKVQEWIEENERLDDELDAICGGESDD